MNTLERRWTSWTMTWWNETKGWHFMWSYVLCLICFPLEGLGTVPLASKWPELCQSGAFLWVLSFEGALYGMCEIYRIWNIKVFYLWLFDDLKMSMPQLLVVSTKKTVFQQSGAGTLQRSIEGMSTGHTLAASNVALPGSSKLSTRSKGYLGLYYIILNI